MISRYHPPVHPWSHLPVVSHLVSIRYAAPDNGPTDTCCTPCKCSPVSHQWPVTRGPRGPGIKQSTRLLALTSPHSPLCSPPGHNGLTMAAQSWPRPGHLWSRPHQALPHPHMSEQLQSLSELAGLFLYWTAGREERPPRSDLFVGRHGFCSSCFSLIVKFSFALNSLPLFFFTAFIFWAKTKKVEQRRPSFKLNHSDTEWIAECVSVILQFSVGARLPVSHTVDHVGERQRRVRAN